MSAQREMTLDEWCGRLPESHAANQEIRALRARNVSLADGYSMALEQLADAQVAYVARGMELRDAEARAEQAESDAARRLELLREARAGVKNSAVQFGYPYTELVDRIDAELEGKP